MKKIGMIVGLFSFAVGQAQAQQSFEKQMALEFQELSKNTGQLRAALASRLDPAPFRPVTPVTEARAIAVLDVPQAKPAAYRVGVATTTYLIQIEDGSVYKLRSMVVVAVDIYDAVNQALAAIGDGSDLPVRVYNAETKELLWDFTDYDYMPGGSKFGSGMLRISLIRRLSPRVIRPIPSTRRI